MSWLIQSGIDGYLSACARAAHDDQFFNTFKQSGYYRPILEHVSRDMGAQYLNDTKIEFLDKLELIKQNDTQGSPETHYYPVVGEISPTTLRYLKHTSDIITHFGSDLKTIVEIGGGYGGLCKTLSCFVNFENYTIIDLEEPNCLARKYLSKFNLPVSSCRLDEVHEQNNFDLLISNYAFSELSRDTQEEYLAKVIVKCNMFYMIFNDMGNNIHHDEFINIMLPTHDVEYSSEFGIETESKILVGRKKQHDCHWGIK